MPVHNNIVVHLSVYHSYHSHISFKNRATDVTNVWASYTYIQPNNNNSMFNASCYQYTASVLKQACPGCLREYCTFIKKSAHKCDSYCYSSAEQAVILDLSVRTE